MLRCLHGPWRAALLAAVLAGCAPTATNLTPGRIPHGHGTVMGHVRVEKGGADVTGSCRIGLNDERGEFTSRRLDWSGWVFTSMPKGKFIVRDVVCSTWGGLFHFTHREFEVAGDGRSTYFGHLEFDLVSHDREHAAAAILSAQGVPQPLLRGISAAVRGKPERRFDHEAVAERLNETAVEYRRRYRAAPPDPVISLANTPHRRSVEQPPSKATRTGDVISAEANLDGVRLSWLADLAGEAPRIAVRLRRYSRETNLPQCRELVVKLDEAELRLPGRYHQVQFSASTDQTLQAETDLETVKRLLSAKTVTLSMCTWAHDLTPNARTTGANFVAAYEAAVAQAGAAPADLAETSGETRQVE